MRTKDPGKRSEAKDLENNPRAQGPKRGQTQGDRDRQRGAANLADQHTARTSRPHPNAGKGAARGRRGTSENT